MNPYNKRDNKTYICPPEILDEIKTEHPVIYSSIFESNQFQERITRILQQKNLKHDFSGDVVPILQKWIETAWGSGNLDKPSNLVLRDAIPYVVKVMETGGLKKGKSQINGHSQPSEFKPSKIPYNNPHED
jgi:hypothetical protein